MSPASPCHGVSGWELVDYDYTPPGKRERLGTAVIRYERQRRDGSYEETTVTRRE